MALHLTVKACWAVLFLRQHSSMKGEVFGITPKEFHDLKVYVRTWFPI